MKQNNLFILSNGKVASINKKDGSIVWEIKLKAFVKNSLSYSIGQINIEGDKLYIGISGILICLNAKDGSLLWLNELKGWGYGFVSMASADSINNAALQASASASIAASTAATSATL